MKGKKPRSMNRGEKPSKSRSMTRGKLAGLDPVECAERLRFETLLTDLSARFIHLSAEQVDDAIVDAQRRICECTGLDVVVLWQWEVDKPGLFTLTHHYRRMEGPPLTSQMKAAEFFPWGLREVQAGRRFLFPSLDMVPEGAARDQASFLYFGVLNALVLPMSIGGGAPLGAISFHDMVAPRVWSDSLIQRLELVARIFANALARRRYELALRESEERLALAADSAGVGLWSLDLATRSYWTTDKAKETFGFGSGESVTLERVLAATLPEDRDLLRQVIDKVVATGIEGRVEYRIVRTDGSLRWVVSRGRVHGPPGKPPTHLMGVTTDITDSKNVERSLKQSEFRLAAAMDIAELGFYEVANGDRVSYLDSRAREIIGASTADEEAGRIFEFWGAHIHPEDLPSVMELNRVLNEGGQNRLTVDYRFLHPERGVIHIHHLVHVIERNAAGRAMRTIGVLKDITERKRTEDAIRKSETRLALAIDTAELGLYEEIGPPENRLTTSDERALRLAGAPLDHGGRLREFWLAHVYPDDLPYVIDTTRGFDVEGQDLVTMEYRYWHGERGLIWLRHLVRALARDSDGRVVRTVGVLQDITERKTAEIEARRAQNELAHATRMSMLGELAASMAHELNQPLAAILSNAQAARRFLAVVEPDLKEIREILDDIVRDDKRAGDVIHHMRAMVKKKGAVVAEPLDFNELVRDTTKLLHSEMVGRNIGLELKLAPKLPFVLAGRVEMQQVLLNLMVNAMDAMLDQPADRRQLRIQTSVVNGWVHVALRDHGHGISDDAMANIFRPFYTTKTHGLGMGLSISRSMVEAHDGKLWAENAVDGGAIFWIEMPAREEERGTGDEGRGEQPRSEGRGTGETGGGRGKRVEGENRRGEGA